MCWYRISLNFYFSQQCYCNSQYAGSFGSAVTERRKQKIFIFPEFQLCLAIIPHKANTHINRLENKNISIRQAKIKPKKYYNIIRIVDFIFQKLFERDCFVPVIPQFIHIHEIYSHKKNQKVQLILFSSTRHDLLIC